jgi:O-antigen ligase
VAPFLIYLDSSGHPRALTKMPQGHLENQIFWPAVTAISIALAVRYSSRLSRLAWSPHIISLAACLMFAGTTAIWAFNPAVSFTRFCAEAMMVTAIVLPGMLANRTTDMMRGVFLTFTAVSVLNFIVIVDDGPTVVDGAFYYSGYFTDKNTLGECASVAFLLALHEVLYSGFRRVLGIAVVIISAYLVFVSNSKTSFGLAVLSPLLAAPLVLAGKKMRISPAAVLLPVFFLFLILYVAFSKIFNHISYILYSNYTFSARTLIWDFVRSEIDHRPLLGWGYQSFWQVGPGGPSIVDGWGWIRTMPHGHNGYLDTMLEMGYFGFAFLLIFIFTTLHASLRMIERDAARAWIVLSLALYEIITNFFESTWLRGDDPVWVMFVILVAEIGRYWYPYRAGGRSQQLTRRAAGERHFSNVARRRGETSDSNLTSSSGKLQGESYA